MWVTKQFLVFIDFHSHFQHTMEVSADQQLFGSIICEESFVCVCILGIVAGIQQITSVSST